MRYFQRRSHVFVSLYCVSLCMVYKYRSLKVKLTTQYIYYYISYYTVYLLPYLQAYYTVYFLAYYTVYLLIHLLARRVCGAHLELCGEVVCG